MTLRRRLQALVGACAVGAALAACTSPAEHAEPDVARDDPPAGSPLEEALRTLPPDTTTVFFIDQGAVAARLGFAGLPTGASQDELDRWERALRGEMPTRTALSGSLSMMQAAAFSALDIEWEAMADRSGVRPVRVWRMREALDFDAVAADLEDAGYVRSGDDRAPRFTNERAAAEDGAYGGRYPTDVLTEVALVPEEQAIVTGDLDAGIAAVLDDRSLAEDDAFRGLLERAPSAPGLEFAALSIAPVCAPGRPVGDEAMTDVEAAGLRRPDGGLAYYGHPARPIAAVRLFHDRSDATVDSRRVAAYLDRPARSGVDATFSTVQRDRAVISETRWEAGSAVVHAFFSSRGPFACPAD